jgi:hypothetical protein
MKRAMIKTLIPTRIIILASSIPLPNHFKVMAVIRKLQLDKLKK